VWQANTNFIGFIRRRRRSFQRKNVPKVFSLDFFPVKNRGKLYFTTFRAKTSAKYAFLSFVAGEKPSKTVFLHFSRVKSLQIQYFIIFRRWKAFKNSIPSFFVGKKPSKRLFCVVSHPESLCRRNSVFFPGQKSKKIKFKEGGYLNEWRKSKCKPGEWEAGEITCLSPTRTSRNRTPKRVSLPGNHKLQITNYKQITIALFSAISAISAVEFKNLRDSQVNTLFTF